MLNILIIIFVVLMIDKVATDLISTIAGTGIGSYSGDGGTASSATLNAPTGVAVDSSGNVYIADNSNNRVRKLTVSTGIITTYAGTGTPSFSGDGGQATSAGLNGPYGVSLYTSNNVLNNVYIADLGNHRIRKVTVSTGVITTVAGTGISSYSGDNGAATSAALFCPTGVITDASANVYIADCYNYRIRKVTVSTGIITTIAGTGTSTYSGDNNAATSAGLSNPSNVAVDSSGNVYIADFSNSRIRKVTVSTGIITTIAGTGTASFSGDGGAATSAALNYPWGVAVDSSGNVYIGDSTNSRIRKVTSSTGIITTVAGTGTSSYSGDTGEATSATLSEPNQVAVSASGSQVYVADKNNNRIRMIYPAPTFMPTPAPTATPTIRPSTKAPTVMPTVTPTIKPTTPTGQPTRQPSGQPSRQPSTQPTRQPSGQPTRQPTRQPTSQPSSMPSSQPTIRPTIRPSSQPSVEPSGEPTGQPSSQPSSQPSIQPSSEPTSQPSSQPSSLPSSQPSAHPSVQPTAMPTSVPSPLDIIEVNVLTEPITSRVVRIKLSYYMGTFITYFLIWWIILLVVDSSKPFSTSIKRLHDSAFASGVFNPSLSHQDLCDRTSNISNLSIFSRRKVSTLAMSKLQRLDYEISSLNIDEKRRQSFIEDHGSKHSEGSSKIIYRLTQTRNKSTYSDSFYAYLDQQRTYLGCDPLFYPTGHVSICCKTWHLPAGVMEDYLLFLCNKHSMLNCIFACDGAPVDHVGNRLIYVLQNCIAFFFSAISGSVFNYFGISDNANVLFDILMTTPATIAIAKIIKSLYYCSQGFSVEYGEANPCVIKTLKLLGKLAMIPIIIAIAGLLVLSAIFSRGYNTYLIVISFFAQVQLYGFFFEMAKYSLLFVPSYYLQVSIELQFRTIILLEIGCLYTEIINRNCLIEGKDYHCSCYYVLCFVRVERIHSSIDAVKNGLVTKQKKRASNDVEMPSMLRRSSVDTKENEEGVSNNVITKDLPQARVSYSEIYSASPDCQYANTKGMIDTLNAMRSTLTAVSNRNSDALDEIDDDETPCPSTHQDQGTEHDSNSDEERKARRKKQFIAGIRRSFVTAFQVFETREEESESVINTIHLNNANNKNKANPLDVTARRR